MCEVREVNLHVVLLSSQLSVVGGKQAGAEEKVWQRSDGSVMRGGYC